MKAAEVRAVIERVERGEGISSGEIKTLCESHEVLRKRANAKVRADLTRRYIRCGWAYTWAGIAWYTHKPVAKIYNMHRRNPIPIERIFGKNGKWGVRAHLTVLDMYMRQHRLEIRRDRTPPEENVVA